MSPGLESCHALVLNADFRPLSYFPLSIWSWQDAVKAVFLDRVSVISEYERMIHSPSFDQKRVRNSPMTSARPETRRITKIRGTDTSPLNTAVATSAWIGLIPRKLNVIPNSVPRMIVM